MAAIELYSTPLFSDANLVSYWRMEGNSTDEIGSNNGSDSNVTYSEANGKFGQGAGFVGTGSITDSSPTGISLNTFSLSFWTKTADGSGGGDAFTNYLRVGDNHGFRIKIDATILAKNYKPATPTSKTVTADIDIRDGDWHLVNYVKSSTTYEKIYVDGDLIVNDTTDLYDADYTGTLLVMGNRDGDDVPYTGQIDDVAYFSRILDPTEISNLYNGTWPSGGNPIFFSGGGIGVA